MKWPHDDDRQSGRERVRLTAQSETVAVAAEMPMVV
jgi:hypothetical protein